jgi:hypothetical protein
MTKYNKEHVETLIGAMNDFIKSLGQALEVNQSLIKPDQLTLQHELNNAYQFFQEEVTKYMTLDLVPDDDDEQAQDDASTITNTDSAQDITDTD